MSGSRNSTGGQEAAAAPVSTDKRHAAGGQVITMNRRHRRMATARAVKTRTTRATKKARGTRVRVRRAMTEASPKEKGDNRHINQPGTKVTAMERTVVVTTARARTMAARAMATGAKRATAKMATMAMAGTTAIIVTMATMTPNSNKHAKQQQRHQGPSNED